MPDSPPARRMLSDAMRREPETDFNRYLRETVEPTLPERYRFPGRRKRFSPWRDIPAYGLAIVALLLIARWVAGMVGMG